MMTYFKIRGDNGIKGPYPQSIAFGTDVLIPDGMTSIIQLDFDSVKEPFIAPILLRKKAQLTDYISTGYLRDGIHVISERFLNILTKYNLPKYYVKDIPVITYSGEQITGYKYIYSRINNLKAVIDFERTVFRLFYKHPDRKIFRVMKSNLKFRSFDDSKNLSREYNRKLTEDSYHNRKLTKGSYYGCEIKELYLSQDPLLDWFCFVHTGQGGEMFSERLYDELMRNNITGLRFELLDWMAPAHS